MHGRTSKRLRGLAAAVAALGLLAALAVLAGASRGANGSSTAARTQTGQKVTICHHTHSRAHPFVQITVAAPALQAHLKHGDTLGACPASPTTASNTHGEGH